MSLELRAAVLMGYFALISWNDLAWPALPWVPTPPQEPPSAVAVGQPPLPSPAPCSANSAAQCHVFTMLVDTGLRMFTADDFAGRALETLDGNLTCLGRVQAGRLRYFVDGTAPSALVGIYVPVRPEVVEADNATDPEGTREDSGDAVLLTNRDQVLRFKATAADWAGGELTWECALPQ